MDAGDEARYTKLFIRLCKRLGNSWDVQQREAVMGTRLQTQSSPAPELLAVEAEAAPRQYWTVHAAFYQLVHNPSKPGLQQRSAQLAHLGVTADDQDWVPSA